MSEFERGEQLNAIVRSWNPEAERLRHQIERAREALEWRSEPSNEWRRRLLTPDERIRKALDILSEDASDAKRLPGNPKLGYAGTRHASDANETQDSEGSA